MQAEAQPERPNRESGMSPTTSAKQSRSKYALAAYEFGDQCPPSGYRWFARWRIGLGHRDMDLSEPSGPARPLSNLIARREALYSDFIRESARLLVDAMQYNVNDLQKLIPIYALMSRIRLSSSDPVLQTAEHVKKTIVSTYPQPNLTVEQIESQAGTV